MTTATPPKKPLAAVRQVGPTALDVLFAGGATAVFLAIMVSLVGALDLYFR